MLFNTIDFAFFLPVVFLLYWFVFRTIRLQNLLIVAASYFFYASWNWKFLSLIVISTLIDYFVARSLVHAKGKSRRQLLLSLSIFSNLGMLMFFKYYNFFVENFVEAFRLFGQEISAGTLDIVLPVGISFYTFQTLSYTIDVYREKLKPTRDIIQFAAFVSFFPQLVAGPIERATNLLPQFKKERSFNYAFAVDGMRQILWGLFKKVVIADNCAEYVNIIFADPDAYGGSTLLLGAALFAFQIYGDFSGYSDIAIGVSKLFGFSLMRNFAYPYFSRDMAEFWRRWHISLSTWFRDYLYIPLGGSRGGKGMQLRNTMIIFLVSGFWHGASWTFIAWGFINAVYFVPLLLSGNNRNHIEIVAHDRFLPGIKDVLKILLTFFLACIAWVFFRAETMSIAWDYLAGIFDTSLLSLPVIRPMKLFLLLLIFIVAEWLGRRDGYALFSIDVIRFRGLRWLVYVLIFALVIYYNDSSEQFIYFQF